jgi:ubiquinone biosynthesis monooxygenase Coq7
MRDYSLLDQVCLKTDKLLRFLSGNLSSSATRESPAKNLSEPNLNTEEKKHIAGLMRVNYAGEVCAQALYQGQALTARNRETKYKLENAGLEEVDHLYWCQSRLQELNASVSFLNPFWYAGSFALGVVAGICGDKWSLGFLEETEKQVVKHLESHLEKLPSQDNKTRVILEQMREDENSHAEIANDAGAEELPQAIKTAMNFTSTFMTKTAYWI